MRIFCRCDELLFMKVFRLFFRTSSYRKKDEEKKERELVFARTFFSVSIQFLSVSRYQGKKKNGKEYKCLGEVLCLFIVQYFSYQHRVNSC